MLTEKVKLELIDDNPYQPRSVYHKEDIDDIAASIKEHGQLQNPLARRKDGRVQLGFGHLRKRAFLKLAKEDPDKWGAMPLDIRDLSDEQMAMFALEENLKRRDITPIEVARAVDKYLESFADTTEQNLAKQLSMTQGNVSNMRRVLRLPEQVLEKIDQGRINFTMGRELLVFQGIVAGKTQHWSQKAGGYIDAPKDEKFLMLEAIHGIKTETQRWGESCTVEGIQRCIHSVASSHLQPLEKEYGYSSREPLFDTRAAGCLKCDHVIRTHPTKSKTAHWCTNKECWDTHQQEHKDRVAAAARAKMTVDVLQKVAAAEEQRQADISQEIPPELREKARALIRVPDEQLEKIKASYSADRISRGEPVRKPFEFEGKLYISVGGRVGGTVTPVQEAYQLVAKDEFAGEVQTYRVPDGREYEEYYESLRSNPMGFYHGMLIKRGKTDHVLVGPPISLASKALDISQEIPPELREKTDAVDQELEERADQMERALDQAAESAEAAMEPEEIEFARARMEQLKNMPPDYPCKGCLNIGRCDGTGVYAVDGGGLKCDQRLTKETAAELEGKATLEIPPELQSLVLEKAGTRAEVLDLNDLWVGSFRQELRQGYALLSDVERIDDPAECLERCTQGFHYGYDSRYTEGRVLNVCTNPKCLSKKRAAFTRAKNAQGQAKKKAETAAIKRAVQETTELDPPRAKLIIMAQLEGRTYYGEGMAPRRWWRDKLGVEQKNEWEIKTEAIYAALDRLTEEELAKLVVEFMLETLTYRGDLGEYCIQTTQPLNWMGIGVN